MSFIRKQYNSKTKTTYVYEVKSYWDSSTKMPRARTKLIGKVDPVTGETVPTGKRGRPKKEKSSDSVESGYVTTLGTDEILEIKNELLMTRQKNLQLESENNTSREEIKRLKAKLERATTTLNALKKALDRHVEAFEENM